MPGLTNNTKLLLHFDGINGDILTYDSSPENYTVVVSGNAKLSDSQKKWGTTSLILDGINSYVAITSNDNDFEISRYSYFSYDFWLKHNNIPSGRQAYFNNRESGTITINCENTETNDLEFYIYIVTGYKIRMQTSGISDTNWHHIAVIKVNNNYGLYLDGIQKGYYLDSTAWELNNNIFRIGSIGGITGYMNGYIDEFRVEHANYFNALPNSELTDTINVPTGAYSTNPIINKSILI